MKSTITLAVLALLTGGLMSSSAWADPPIFARAAWQGVPPAAMPAYTAVANRWENRRDNCGNFRRDRQDRRRLHNAFERERFLQAQAWRDQNQLFRDRERERMEAERIRRDERIADRDRFGNNFFRW